MGLIFYTVLLAGVYIQWDMLFVIILVVYSFLVYRIGVPPRVCFIPSTSERLVDD